MTESMPKVALLEDINPAAHNVFNEAGFRVIRFPKSVTEAQLTEIAQSVSMLGVRSGPAVPRSVYEGAYDLHALGGFCVDPQVDNIEAEEAGIALFNSVHENTRSVAEHVIGKIFDLFRRTAEHNQSLHNDGTWTKTDDKSFEVRRKTLGIVGYGNIGSQVSVLAESIGMDVVWYDPKTIFPSYGRAERLQTLDEVLAAADVVTLHVPETPSTRHMMNAQTIAKMKTGSYLINAARGGLIDDEALTEALNSGQLAGAAIDVFAKGQEPAKRGDPFEHPLRGIRNVILTPHVAGSTIESQRDIGQVVADKMVRFWQTGDTYESRTLPKFASMSERHNGNQRIVYIHKNEIGAAQGAIDLIADAGCNIARQQLETSDATGYAYFDIDRGNVTPELVLAIKSLANAKRVRLIG